MIDHLLTPAQIKWREEVRDFVKSIPRQMIVDMDADLIKFPKDFLREAAKRKLLGCRYPQKWGGRDMDWVSSSLAMEEVGVLGYIFACVFGVGAELVCDAIMIHGTDSQKEKYAVPLLKGEIFAAECLTEPRGGSDFFGTSTIAEEKDDHFLINGQKRFIVGGYGADFFLVYARTNPSVEPHKGISCFIVERGPGVETKYIYGLMGCRGGGTSRVVFSDVKVPKENVIGGVNNGFKVFKTMMIPERLGTAAMTVGSARPAFEVATSYSTKRKAFGQTINNYQGVTFQIAESSVLLDASRAMVYVTAKAVDSKIDENRVRRMISETKKFVTESCQKVANLSMQVMGGIGYTNIYPVERIVRDLRLSTIWTGTNEIMSVIIANEWYKEFSKIKDARLTRDSENDAACSGDYEEKVYS